MNSVERITAATGFDKTDRCPVIAQVFGHAAVLDGVPLDQYVQDGEVLARSQMKALAHYGYDAVFALMDVGVETEALGSTLKYRTDQYPTVHAYALTNASDLKKLSVPNALQHGRMPELLRAVNILRHEVGEEVLVVGAVVGPMTLATQLMGAENALFLAIDEPDAFTRLLDFSTDVIIRFGTAQIEAGAHLPIVFDPSASPEVIPPAFYREFVLARFKKIFQSFKAAGASANWLHTAGPVSPILPHYPNAGVDIANIDFCVDPLTAMNALPCTCINGNIKPLSFVDGSAEGVFDESKELIRLFEKRGGFILSSGCEIPPEAKPENIEAMVAAAQ